MDLNIKLLIEWLGTAGAGAGLRSSKISLEDIHKIAKLEKIEVGDKDTRAQLISRIIEHYNPRIDRSARELAEWEYERLLSYFKERKPRRELVNSVLVELKLEPASNSNKSIYKYAARQISEYGMFKRIVRRKE